MALLEICCYSMECALTAQRNGADRIELCAAPKEGGLTPSFGVLRSVREHITIPVHPIIRPRGGDFYYTDGEFAAMLEDIRLVRELGFPGLVTGVLTVDGDVDMSRMVRGFVQITCRISSMPEYGKYTVPPESYCLRRCAIAIRGYRCLPIYRRTSILAIE